MLWRILTCCKSPEEDKDEHKEKPPNVGHAHLSVVSPLNELASEKSRSSLCIEWTIDSLRQFVQQLSVRQNMSKDRREALTYFINSYNDLFHDVYYGDGRSMSKTEEAQTIVTFTIGSYLYKYTHPSELFWQRLSDNMANIEDDGTCTEAQLAFRKRAALSKLGHPAFHFLPMNNKESFHYAWSLFTSTYFQKAATVSPSPNQQPVDSVANPQLRKASEITTISSRSDVDILLGKFKALIQESPDEHCNSWIQRIYITCVLPRNHYIYLLNEQVDFLTSIEIMKNQVTEGKLCLLNEDLGTLN
ncbi:hypothetical protein POMI540_4175 [Schizosaccharomyces pombe]